MWFARVADLKYPENGSIGFCLLRFYTKRISNGA